MADAAGDATSLESLVEPSGDGSIVPTLGHNDLYAKKAFWDLRFSTEEVHEWLGGFANYREVIRAVAPPGPVRVLLVGNGTSELPLHMAEDGYTNVTASDYSEVVIERMAARHASHPAVVAGAVKFAVADMTALPFADGSFDVVIDKAAMDAMMADGGDTWDAPEHLLELTRKVMRETARVLVPGTGVYQQISFGQPHFRKKYLVQDRELWAEGGKVDVKELPVGLGYFSYVLRRA